MRCLIINHHSRFIEELVNLFSKSTYVDVVDYNDFEISMVSEFDFIVLSGGSIHISSQNDIMEEKEFIRTTNKPIFGICLGLEIIGVANGSPLLLLEEKREGFFDFEIFNKTDKMYYSHKHYIKTFSEEFEVLKRSGNIVETIKHKTRPIFALQGHPEMSGKFGRFIIKKFIEKFVKNGGPAEI